MDQFILFGDSITEKATIQQDPGTGFAFQAALQRAYIRRVDIVNRGLSGYNTTQALKVLQRILPRPEQARVRLLTISFGANDARLENTPGPSQAVWLERFKQNLSSIITHPVVIAHEDIKVVLITPPPIEERMQLEVDRTKGYGVMCRTAANTALYAQAVRDIGTMHGVAVCDYWTVCMDSAGGPAGDRSRGDLLPGDQRLPPSARLHNLLSDGLHLKSAGYELLYECLMLCIARYYPELVPERLPIVLPAWDEAEAWRE